MDILLLSAPVILEQYITINTRNSKILKRALPLIRMKINYTIFGRFQLYTTVFLAWKRAHNDQSWTKIVQKWFQNWTKTVQKWWFFYSGRDYYGRIKQFFEIISKWRRHTVSSQNFRSFCFLSFFLSKIVQLNFFCEIVTYTSRLLSFDKIFLTWSLLLIFSWL